jgi:hypothetical protein
VPAADRYLRTGTGIPEIYPGTLAMLARAVKAARQASARYPGEHYLEAVYPSGRLTVQVWEDGACTWSTADS